MNAEAPATPVTPAAAPKKQVAVQDFFICEAGKIVEKVGTAGEATKSVTALIDQGKENITVIRGREIPVKQQVVVKLSLRDAGEGDDASE